MPKLPSQGRWGCRGSVGRIGNTQLGYEHVGTVAQRRKGPSLALGKAAGCFPPVSHYKVILRQADPVPQLWGGQGVLGALLLPTPTEAEQSRAAKGQFVLRCTSSTQGCSIVATQFPVVSRG